MNNSETELLETIRSHGYWRVVIRPGDFYSDRVGDISSLYPILQKTSVALRRWDFPHLDPHMSHRAEQDWLLQSSEVNQYLELWRFDRSGDFSDLMGMEEDWLDRFHDWPLPTGSYLDVDNVLLHFTDIFEFAARLSMTEAGGESMHLEIDVFRQQGRVLKVERRREGSSFLSEDGAFFLRGYGAGGETFSYLLDVSKTELITTSQELALKPTLGLLQCFGWNPRLQFLRDLQIELLAYGPAAIGRGDP